MAMSLFKYNESFNCLCMMYYSTVFNFIDHTVPELKCCAPDWHNFTKLVCSEYTLKVYKTFRSFHPKSVRKHKS